MRTVISLIMAVVATLNASLDMLGAGGGLSRPAERQSPVVMADTADQAPPTVAPAPTEEPVYHGDLDWDEMAYEHYDPESFYAGTDRLTALAAGQDQEAIRDLYEQLNEEFIHIDTLASIAYIHYCQDVTDPYWSAERIYCDTLATEAADALSTACAAVMDGPCAGSFSQHTGQSAAKTFAEYDPMTDREAELTVRESELVDQYNTIMAGADQITYSYLGQTWTREMINSFQGVNLAYRDYDGYLEVFYGLQKALNDQVGPVFVELVRVRAEIARIEGYDSYADLAYEQFFGRDYTPADAQTLCDAVKPVAQVYLRDFYYSDLWNEADSIEPVLTADEQIQALGRIAAEIDPILTEPWQYMTDHGLCLLTDDPKAYPGGYTITISEYNCPLIFNDLSNNWFDFKTLTHEFGHFANDYYTPLPDLLTDVGNYDLLEIHSTGLELLCTEYYDQVYTQGADLARFLVLAAQMEQVIDGCIYDEFQREIYAQPDMTLEDMNRLFARISAQYGVYEIYDFDYSWIYVSHTFETPLYYISYTASSLGAIQIWALARQDLQTGVQAWKAIMNADVCAQGYLTVLPACGLRVFTEENAVAEICAPLMEELERLSGSA